MLEETDYVDRVIYEATLVHLDKSKANIDRMRNYYPFQVNEDEIDADDSVSMTEESGFTDSGNESGSDVFGARGQDWNSREQLHQGLGEAGTRRPEI